MELLNLIFNLGVLFSIYGFLWFFIELGFTLLSGARKRTQVEIFLLKAAKYAFLVNVTFLYSVDLNNYKIFIYNVLPSALILMSYFIGMLQKTQRQQIFMASFAKQSGTALISFKSEIILFSLSGCFFFFLLWFPQYAENTVALWFQKSILDIESTVIIGFIFKIIGFFFLLGMIFKMFNAIYYITFGKPIFNVKSKFTNTKKNKNDSDFDEYEELN